MTVVVDLDTLLKKFTPQDVIAAIFAYADLPKFSSDREFIHDFIHKKKTESDDLLEVFVFSRGVDLFPFSRLLESVLMQLQMGGLLSAINPDYEQFGMNDDVRAEVKEKMKARFSKQQLNVLQRLGKEFKTFISER